MRYSLKTFYIQISLNQWPIQKAQLEETGSDEEKVKVVALPFLCFVIRIILDAKALDCHCQRRALEGHGKGGLHAFPSAIHKAHCLAARG